MSAFEQVGNTPLRKSDVPSYYREVGVQWIIGVGDGLWGQTGPSSNLHSTFYGLCPKSLILGFSSLHFSQGLNRTRPPGQYFAHNKLSKWLLLLLCHPVKEYSQCCRIIQHSLVVISAVLQKRKGCIWDLSKNKTDKKENRCSLRNLNEALESLRKHS